ncbi:hypothetical protein L2E82_32448 [Cichorium intybus]|uniref:Uncharacterized protein n=1 Tax=Cichorium intybus TaxID=13427 RepID=A0ACB9BH93_CICIN|nr:hypothetical protein L2E82_32448 [Cichorium intybus]
MCYKSAFESLPPSLTSVSQYPPLLSGFRSSIDAKVPIRIEIEGFESSSLSEEVKLKPQKLRDNARTRNKEEDMKLEPRREKERIRAGKEVQEAKRIAEESERKRSLSRNPDFFLFFVERRAELGLPLQNQASLKTVIPMVQENKVVPVNSTPKVDLMRDCLTTKSETTGLQKKEFLLPSPRAKHGLPTS